MTLGMTSLCSNRVERMAAFWLAPRGSTPFGTVVMILIPVFISWLVLMAIQPLSTRGTVGLGRQDNLRLNTAGTCARGWTLAGQGFLPSRPVWLVTLLSRPTQTVFRRVKFNAIFHCWVLHFLYRWCCFPFQLLLQSFLMSIPILRNQRLTNLI